MLEEGATLPTRKNPDDAGIDLYAYEDIEINPIGIVRTGVHIELPEGTVGLIFPKSRNNHLVMAGVVDVKYRGEILVKIFSPLPLQIKKGDAIAQLVIIPAYFPIPFQVDKLSEAVRESDGGVTKQKFN